MIEHTDSQIVKALPHFVKYWQGEKMVEPEKGQLVCLYFNSTASNTDTGYRENHRYDVDKEGFEMLILEKWMDQAELNELIKKQANDNL